MDKTSLLKIVRELFDKVHVFALMTMDSGYPVARPVSGVILHDENTILVSTSRSSKKFQHISKQPSATFFMHTDEKYLNIRGKPSLEDNPALKRKYWSDSWREYYPDGLGSDEYVFFKLIIEHISYKDFAGKVDVEMDF
jgi:general stress protein 26